LPAVQTADTPDQQQQQQWASDSQRLALPGQRGTPTAGQLAAAGDQNNWDLSCPAAAAGASPVAEAAVGVAVGERVGSSTSQGAGGAAGPIVLKLPGIVTTFPRSGGRKSGGGNAQQQGVRKEGGSYLGDLS
jgi:hypothetical protein